MQALYALAATSGGIHYPDGVQGNAMLRLQKALRSRSTYMPPGGEDNPGEPNSEGMSYGQIIWVMLKVMTGCVASLVSLLDLTASSDSCLQIGTHRSCIRKIFFGGQYVGFDVASDFHPIFGPVVRVVARRVLGACQSIRFLFSILASAN